MEVTRLMKPSTPLAVAAPSMTFVINFSDIVRGEGGGGEVVSRDQVGTKSGPRRDQVGTKSGLSRDHTYF